MTCAQCAAGALMPLIEGGTTARKIAQKSRKAALNFELTSREKADIHACADTLEWLAAELFRLRRES